MMPTFEPGAFAVLETDNQFVTWDFIAGWPDACHEHISEAINVWKDSGENPPEYGVKKLFTESQLQQAYEAGKRDAMPEWISVEKQLPVLHKGYSEDCLVITNFGNRLISRYDSYSKSWSLYQHEDHIVTLWMTLLAAPKGG